MLVCLSLYLLLELGGEEGVGVLGVELEGFADVGQAEGARRKGEFLGGGGGEGGEDVLEEEEREGEGGEERERGGGEEEC